MNEAGKIGIVDHFKSHYTIEDVRKALVVALPAYKELVDNEGAVPEHLEAEMTLLDLLAIHKGWYGYLEWKQIWDKFESYVRDEGGRAITFKRLDRIYCDVYAI